MNENENLKQACSDLLCEYQELAGLAEKLSGSQWQQPSGFYGWTPFDEIAHLCFFDEAGLLAATDTEAFQREAAALVRQVMAGQEISRIARQHYAGHSPEQLLDLWRSRYVRLLEALAGKGEKERLPWYGPSMSPRSFITARQMEVWAHGQDIYDLAKVYRSNTSRLRNIANLCVGTFAWAFQNRKQAVPETVPFICLTAPNGDQWSWGAYSDTDYVRGTAEDFCLVLTQRRNVLDTGLAQGGESARAWLQIAQCFAGPPADGPAPGERVVRYAA